MALDYFNVENDPVLTSVFILVIFIYTLLLFWFLLATLTKDYRTNGAPVPFIFALATPFAPLILLLKYILRSKLEKEVNKAWAEKQKQARDQAKQTKKTQKSEKKRNTIDRD